MPHQKKSSATTDVKSKQQKNFRLEGVVVLKYDLRKIVEKRDKRIAYATDADIASDPETSRWIPDCFYGRNHRHFNRTNEKAWVIPACLVKADDLADMFEVPRSAVRTADSMLYHGEKVTFEYFEGKGRRPDGSAKLLARDVRAVNEKFHAVPEKKETVLMKGRCVKLITRTKRNTQPFGFLEPADDSDDVYFKLSDCRTEIQVNDPVQFEVVETNDGKRHALKVCVVDKDGSPIDAAPKKKIVEREIGQLEIFDSSSGEGLINISNKYDIFISQSESLEKLLVGEKVSFEAVERPQPDGKTTRWEATNVHTFQRRYNGRCVRFSKDKGFGFIAPAKRAEPFFKMLAKADNKRKNHDGKVTDVFVHSRDISRGDSFSLGQRVSFCIDREGDRPKAVNAEAVFGDFEPVVTRKPEKTAKAPSVVSSGSESDSSRLSASGKRRARKKRAKARREGTTSTDDDTSSIYSSTTDISTFTVDSTKSNVSSAYEHTKTYAQRKPKRKPKKHEVVFFEGLDRQGFEGICVEWRERKNGASFGFIELRDTVGLNAETLPFDAVDEDGKPTQIYVSSWQVRPISLDVFLGSHGFLQELTAFNDAGYKILEDIHTMNDYDLREVGIELPKDRRRLLKAIHSLNILEEKQLKKGEWCNFKVKQQPNEKGVISHQAVQVCREDLDQRQGRLQDQISSLEQRMDFMNSQKIDSVGDHRSMEKQFRELRKQKRAAQLELDTMLKVVYNISPVPVKTQEPTPFVKPIPNPERTKALREKQEKERKERDQKTRARLLKDRLARAKQGTSSLPSTKQRSRRN